VIDMTLYRKERVVCANCGFVFEKREGDLNSCPKCGSNALDLIKKEDWMRRR